MARKSRKQNNKVEVPIIETSFIQVAAYVRLSLEDRNQKGNSVENQQSIISSFIDENTEFKLYDTYIDSGVSGTTFERPEFQRMMSDAESGKIKCIIVKDLSRLGRNAIDTGYYTESVFPQLGIRLISINDNHDSSIATNGIALPLVNLLNEAYALDISRKTRTQKRQAMKDGVYVGGQPPYGYMRTRDDRRKMIIDESASEIIKQIFMWAADCVSINEIARRLNSAKVPTPGVRRAELCVSKQSRVVASGLWYARTVERILDNEIYTGRLIQGKSKTVNFKRESVASDEWIHAHNAHEAIVSEKLFKDAQVYKEKSEGSSTIRAKIPYSPNIFKGKINCAHCGNSLERTKNRDKYVFRCAAKRMSPGYCDGNYIREDAVRSALFEQLIQYKDVLVSNLSNPSAEIDVLPELRFISMELAHMQDITRTLYESLVTGILTECEYTQLKANHQEKMDSLRQRATELKQKLDDKKHLNTASRESLCMLNGLTDETSLKREHVDRFVERVEVYRDGKVYVGFLRL